MTQVLAGEKTQTRRVVKDGDTPVYEGDDLVAVMQNGRLKWRVGKTYAVQPGRNEASVARIEVTHLKQETAAEVSAEDARREGYESVKAFLDMWREIYGENAGESTVWVISFRLVE